MNDMLNKALEINPEQKLKGFSALKAKKKQIVKDAVAMYKEELWINVFNKGYSLYERGKLDRAIEQFELAKIVNDGKIESYLALNDIYTQMEKSEDAIINLKAALDIDPDNFDVLIAFGTYHYNNGNYQKSIEYYGGVVVDHPSLLHSQERLEDFFPMPALPTRADG